MENDNELLKEIYMEVLRKYMGECSRTVKDYLLVLGINEEILKNIKREKIKSGMLWDSRK